MQSDEHSVARVRALHLVQLRTPAGWSRRPNAVPTVARSGIWNCPNRKTPVAAFHRFDPNTPTPVDECDLALFEVVRVLDFQRIGSATLFRMS